MQPELKLVSQFDKDGDKKLNAAERKDAREYVVRQRANDDSRGPGGRRGGPGGRGERVEPGRPGPKISPADIKSYPDAGLYASNVLRTLFLDFESGDWEKEMEDFHNTDVELPAKLTVDGKVYSDIGVHFRGASSYKMVPTGSKRSFNVSLDFARKNQNLLGYRTLNLLNAHGDAGFVRAVLYSDIARAYIPAPAANFVQVVINGESWGIYVNFQQFNKDFVRDWFGTTQGARWKVPGSPRGRGNLAYLGDNPEDYQRIYEIKSKDEPAAWAGLIRLCKVLEETPPDQLEQALAPLLDIDGTLKFLALENALINNDGYWVRSSDYDLCQDSKGRFHLVPHDVNETFALPGGPGFRGRPRGDNAAPDRRDEPGGPLTGRPEAGARPQFEGVQLDPLVAANDPGKPLLSKLLAVPSLRERYLHHVRDIAENWLDWKTLGPRAAKYQALISEGVKADTRKLASFEAFQNALEGAPDADIGRGMRRAISLKNFADQRREYLLKLPAIKNTSR